MTPDGISIRAVKLDDLDAIAEIYSTLWCNTLRNRGDLEDAKLASRFNIAMQLERSPIALVAESEAGIVAATADRFAASGNEYAQGQINLIIIRPDWQGQGLGRTLIERARAELRAHGRTKFFLMTDNQSDYAFYDHLGMVRIAEDHSQDTGDGFIVYMYGDEA